jgi:hypothetical protein
MSKKFDRDIFNVLEERSKNLDDRHFKEYNYIKEDNCPSVYERNTLKGIQTDNILNQAFFSQKNIKIIQNLLRFKVQEKTGNIISNQSNTELTIIMRAIFFQNAKNLPTNIPEQIDELNNIVIESILPNIISNVQQYQKYLENKRQIPAPIERSINVNSKGSKQLRSVTSTF